MAIASISNYYKSFSGTDTIAFIMLPGCSPVVLGSITTISYSMYRNKKPVINIGRTNINGITRGSRIFAGTMVFTLLNQHWLRDVQSEKSNSGQQSLWLKNIKDIKVDELPLFDIMILSANEYGSSVSMYIYGIDFTDEAQTVSVEDLFTENTFSFVARDITTFKAGTENNMSLRGTSGFPSYLQDEYERYYRLDISFSVESYLVGTKLYNKDDINAIIEKIRKKTLTLMQANAEKHYRRLQRVLSYPSLSPAIGNDVMRIQELLNETGLFNLIINGIYDEMTAQSVREYQDMVGLKPTGTLDEITYDYLLNQVLIHGERTGIVINEDGARIYEFPSKTAPIVDTKEYQEKVIINDFVSSYDDGHFEPWYSTNEGFIDVSDVQINSYQTENINVARLGTVINKNGTHIYESPGTGNTITKTLKYQDSISVHSVCMDMGDDGRYYTWYQVDEGYVMAQDVYCSYYINNNNGLAGKRLGNVVNQTTVYNEPSNMSESVKDYDVGSQVLITDMVTVNNNGQNEEWYVTNDGYIKATDVSAPYYEPMVIEYPSIQYGEEGMYVTLMQTALSEAGYLNDNNITGVFDETTRRAVLNFQEENYVGASSGVVEYDTWVQLLSYNKHILDSITNDTFCMTYNKIPGTYTITKDNIRNAIDDYEITLECDSPINAKISAVSYYNSGNDVKVKTNVYTIQEPQRFNFNTFSNAFIYDPVIGQMPSSVEFIVSPYNKPPYKWIFNVS